MLPLNTSSSGTRFVSQLASGLPVTAAAEQTASGRTQGLVTSQALLGSRARVSPLPGTANPNTISVQGPNGGINLAPTVQATGQQGPGGGQFGAAPAPPATPASPGFGGGGNLPVQVPPVTPGGGGNTPVPATPTPSPNGPAVPVPVPPTPSPSVPANGNATAPPAGRLPSGSA